MTNNGNFALALGLVPLGGAWMVRTYCWGDPLATLGRGVWIGGIVFTIACASSALRARKGRPQAWLALALAVASVVAVFLPLRG